MTTNDRAKFYEKPWFCILMLIFFAPVGIYFLWKYKHFSKNISILLTVASAVFFFFALITPTEDDLSENSFVETSTETAKNDSTKSSDKATPDITTTPDNTSAPESTATADSTTTQSNKVTNASKKKSTKKPTKNTPPKRKDAIGKSNKDVSKFDDFTVISARNDTTGKWKVCSIAESAFDVPKYASSYYKKYFKSNDEVHFIVNFTSKTTTRITCLTNFLDIAIHEYVDKEEHDAKVLCSGQLLNEYHVYLDNGDVEKIQ